MKAFALSRLQQEDPYRILQVEKGSSRTEIRSAYIKQIKELHPDINQEEDTTAAAARLNAAYELILKGLEGRGRGGPQGEDDRLDVFDRPEALPSEVFVNPFACYNVSPLMWDQLQQVVEGAADPEEALTQAGVSFDPGSPVVYLTPRQLSILTQELDRMSAAMDTISIEVAAFFLQDCLLRARVANNRMETSGARG